MYRLCSCDYSTSLLSAKIKNFSSVLWLCAILQIPVSFCDVTNYAVHELCLYYSPPPSHRRTYKNYLLKLTYTQLEKSDGKVTTRVLKQLCALCLLRVAKPSLTDDATPWTICDEQLLCLCNNMAPNQRTVCLNNK